MDQLLRKLLDDVKEQAPPGVLSMDLSSIASAMMKGMSAPTSLDWNRVYSAWLLIGESLRMQRHFLELPVYRGTRKNAEDYWLQQLMMYGLWCRAWDAAEWEPTLNEWIDHELTRDLGNLGPICRRLLDHWNTAHPTQSDADELMELRRRCTKSPPRSMRDHLFFPYDKIAPELAWCRRRGLRVRFDTVAIDLPARDSLNVDAIVTDALVAAGSTHWT